MKALKPIFYSLLLCLILFSSCGKVYFAQPQPTDAKNKYRFPRSFRGVWTEGTDSVTIGKDYFLMHSHVKKQIATAEADTSPGILLKDHKIYFISPDAKELSQGVPYRVVGDSLVYFFEEINEINLGHKAFLRKVGSRYVVNTCNESRWWELHLLERDPDIGVLVRTPRFEILDSLKLADTIFSSEHNHYLNNAWTTQELHALIEQGLFADTLLKLDNKHRILVK